MGVEIRGWQHMAGRYYFAVYSCFGRQRDAISWPTCCRCYASVATKINYYRTLDVDSRCTHAEIKKAYYKLSKAYHPDRHHGDQGAAHKFREVSEAYEVLGNSKLRRLYDRGLLHTADGYRDFEGPRASEPTIKTRSHQPGTKARTGRVDTVSTPASGKIYDFDAWQEIHYGDLLNRRQRASVRYDTMIKNRQSTAFGTEIGFFLLIFGVALGFYGLALAVDTDIDRKLAARREEEKRMNRGQRD